MNSEIFMWVVGIITILALTYGTYRYLLISKRPARIAELCMHIDSILNRNGCDHADKLLIECVHLIEHYEINLAKLNYGKIYTVEELKHAAGLSLERYYNRAEPEFRRLSAEYKALMNMPAEQRNSDQTSRYKELREVVTSFGGSLNDIHLKATALKFKPA